MVVEADAPEDLIAPFKRAGLIVTQAWAAGSVAV
jgi:hypothetical protein